MVVEVGVVVAGPVTVWTVVDLQQFWPDLRMGLWVMVPVPFQHQVNGINSTALLEGIEIVTAAN